MAQAKINTADIIDGAVGMSKIAQAGATTGQAIVWGGSAWAPGTVGGGGSPSVITPAQITANQNDYAPTGWADATLVRLSGDNGIRAINGFSVETSGEVKTLANVGSYPIYLAPEHAGSTAANRIAYFEEVFIPAGAACQIYYDGTSSRWRPMMVPAAGYQVRSGKAVYYDEPVGKIATAVSADNSLFIWGSIQVLNALPSAARPFAVWDLNSGATASGGSGIAYTRELESMAWYGGAHIMTRCVLKSPSALSDATNNYYYFVRIANNPSSGFETQNNSVGLRYHHSNSTNWECFSTNSGGTSTVTDSGVTFAVDTDYDVMVTLNKALTEATFWINGAVVARITTNLPSGAICGPSTQLEKTAGTTARSVYISRFTAAAIAP